MQIPYLHKHALQQIPLNFFLFIGLWFLGLFLGMIVAADLDDLVLPLMRFSISGEVSIIRQLAAVLLPFLFAAIAAYLGKPYLLHIICFFKTFVFGFCSMLIYCTYGSAGWLIRLFLQFSDILSLPLLCWYCLRQFGRSRQPYKDLIYCGLLAGIFVCIDYFAVLPFLAELIDYSMGRYAYSCWI